ncbi:MAG: hypothetical protein V1811_00730, partial [Candidatus Micrarchaeota archaeon]
NRGIVLEEALVAQAVAEQTALEREIKTEWNENYWAAAQAKALLEKQVEDANKLIAERGPRINWLIEFIAKLRQTRELSNNSIKMQDEAANALNLLQELDELLKNAEKDGLNVDAQKQKAQDLRQAIEEMPPVINNSAALMRTMANIREVIDEVKAIALGEYLELAELVEKARGYDAVLESKDKESVFRAEQLVTDGIESHVGELSAVTNEIEEIIEGVKGREKEIVAAALEHGMSIEETVEESWLGELALIKTRIMLKNDSGFDYDGEIAFKPQSAGKTLESGFVSSKSPEVEVANGKIVVHGVEDGREYFVELENKEVVSRIKKIEEQSTATTEKAQLIKRISIECSRQAKIRAREDFRHAASLVTVSAPNKYAERIETGSEARAEYAFECGRGMNEIEIQAVLFNPFQVSKAYLANSTKLSIAFSFENKFGFLNNATVNAVENAGCSAYGEKAFSSRGKATIKASGGVLLVDLQAEDILADERLSILVEAFCSSFEEAAEAKIIELAASNASELQLMLAQEKQGDGDFQKAWEIASKALADAKVEPEPPKSEVIEWSAPSAEEPKTDEEETKESEVAFYRQELEPRLRQAKSDFEQAFWADDESAGKRKSSLFYQKAKGALDEAEKSASKMNTVVEKQLKEGKTPYTLEYLEKNNEELTSWISQLETGTLELKDETEKQVALALEQQKQFGNASTAVEIEAIQKAVGESKTFIAYVKAKQFNDSFFNKTENAEAAGIDFKLLFGALGACILIGLYYFLSNRKETEFKLLE